MLAPIPVDVITIENVSIKEVACCRLEMTLMGLPRLRQRMRRGGGERGREGVCVREGEGEGEREREREGVWEWVRGREKRESLCASE